MKRLLTLLPLMLFPLLAFAQGNTSFAWEAGDIALTYPADWAEPQASGDTLTLRAIDADTVGVPTIVIARVPSTSNDLYTMLQSLFEDFGIIPTGPLDAELVDFSGVGTSGSSPDAALYATGRIARLADSTTLYVIGTVAAAEREAFIATFNAIADSISLGAASTPRISSAYGVLWQTPTVNGDAFTTVAGIAAAQDGMLYAVDSQLGVVKLDAQTGEVQEVFQPSIVTAPTDIAVDADGLLYVADLACACVVVLTPEGVENGTIDGFNVREHLSLVVTPEGQIFTADDNNVASNGRSLVNIAAGSLLALDNAGRVLALSPDGALWALEGNTLEMLLQLNNLPPINDITIDADNHLLLATATQGVLIYDLNGQEIGQVGRVVPSFPLPGEIVSPTAIAVNTDGTLFWADSGTLTAMSASIQGSSGTGSLTMGLAVQGILNEFTPQQAWTFSGTAGQVITITAIDDNPDNTLDVALRLLSPAGNEEAFNDDNVLGDLPARSDAQIFAHTLETSGNYLVLVEDVSGEGTYVLGVSEGVQNIDISVEAATTLQGELQAVFPVQRWAFSGFAGQVFTVTMLAESGDLDPLLRLRDSGGNVLAENDDAADPALGLNSQLLQVSLPADGAYTIEAVRFDGAGRYSLIIVATSQ